MKHKFVNFIGVIAIMLTTISAFGQQQFTEGYIITQNRDTLRGYIREQPPKLNYQTCLFTESPSGKTSEYKPSEILGYGFNNAHNYISHEFYSKDSLEYERVYIRRFYEGKVSLYEMGGSYYFAEKDNQFYFLGNSSEVRGLGEEQKLRQKQSFIGQLMILFEGVAANIKPQIEETRLRTKSLSQITDLYHKELNLREDTYGPLVAKQTFSIKTTLLSSYLLNSFTHNHRDIEAARVNMIPSSHWEAGVRFDFFLPALGTNSSLYFRAGYERFSGQTHASYEVGPKLTPYDIYIFADYSAVNVSAGLSFPLNNLPILYPSFIHVGYKSIFIFDEAVYEFSALPDELEFINFNQHQKEAEISQLNPGAILGFWHIKRINKSADLVIGLEASFNVIPFNDETRYQTSVGLNLGVRF